MRTVVIQSSLLTIALLALSVAIPCFAAEKMGTVTIKLPDETAKYLPGPGEQTANNSCRTCHSVDYIYMQPPLTSDKWRGEVLKMKKVYGAQIDDKDVDTIVNYLMSQNGKAE
jgi:mono/diheme cytochrome c family protein